VSVLGLRVLAARDGGVASRRPRRSWVVPLTLAFAGAVIAPRLGRVRRALDTVVRCGSGHLFTTLWFRLGSFKAIRLGRRRVQWCPVGRHFAIVRRVDQSELSPEDLEEAYEHHDLLLI
jgi:hypothetical protein